MKKQILMTNKSAFGSTALNLAYKIDLLFQWPMSPHFLKQRGGSGVSVGESQVSGTAFSFIPVSIVHRYYECTSGDIVFVFFF